MGHARDRRRRCYSGSGAAGLGTAGGALRIVGILKSAMGSLAERPLTALRPPKPAGLQSAQERLDRSRRELSVGNAPSYKSFSTLTGSPESRHFLILSLRDPE